MHTLLTHAPPRWSTEVPNTERKENSQERYKKTNDKLERTLWDGEETNGDDTAAMATSHGVVDVPDRHVKWMIFNLTSRDGHCGLVGTKNDWHIHRAFGSVVGLVNGGLPSP